MESILRYTVGPPFVATSLWNMPISKLAPVYSGPNAIENVHLRDASLGYTWANNGTLINKTPADAPIVSWAYEMLNQTPVGGGWHTNGTLSLATPVGMTFLGGDGDAIFNDPTSTHYWECWLGSYNAITKTYNAISMIESDYVKGTGWGKPGAGAGVRAAGCSLLGGVITQSELTALSIPHALPMILSASLMKAGKVQSNQFVYPAVSADGNSLLAYTGTIPMGAHFALPPGLVLSGAGLSPGGLSLARAYQTYGGYVVDTGGNVVSLATVEGLPWPASEADMNWIRNNLVMLNVPPPLA